MTPADVRRALARAAGAPVEVRSLGAGAYGAVVEEPQVVAERMRSAAGVLGVEVSGAFLTVRVAPEGVVSGILAEGNSYGDKGFVGPAGWSDRPRTFENPGFRVRYAFARSFWVGEWARELGVRGGDVSGRNEELLLLGALGELPGRADQARRERQALPLVRFLVRLGDIYHDFFERYPAVPKGDEKPGAVHAARVTLASVVGIALGNGMKMIGETPRERI
ncbi:anticodon-binding protein [Actinomadura barringtoniae]|uniref:Anticodon-binding protein n=1 Tax=Actinomadura barringtoniae TaxID=1427535 RepID=A0A939T4G8_9ACTN|nr:DALR anticodon-binding domain-containing protein [Actinomadura barringtoniae]MBO2448194.1 anticodon-binding protein [Actinomadura barringtoniae]